MLLSRSVVSDSATLWTVAGQAPLSMGFSWQEYWSGLSFPPPWDLPDPRIKPCLLKLLHWLMESLLLSHLGSPKLLHKSVLIWSEDIWRAESLASVSHNLEFRQGQVPDSSKALQGAFAAELPGKPHKGANKFADTWSSKVTDRHALDHRRPRGESGVRL